MFRNTICSDDDHLHILCWLVYLGYFAFYSDHRFYLDPNIHLLLDFSILMDLDCGEVGKIYMVVLYGYSGIDSRKAV